MTAILITSKSHIPAPTGSDFVNSRNLADEDVRLRYQPPSAHDLSVAASALRHRIGDLDCTTALFPGP